MVLSRLLILFSLCGIIIVLLNVLHGLTVRNQELKEQDGLELFRQMDVVNNNKQLKKLGEQDEFYQKALDQLMGDEKYFPIPKNFRTQVVFDDSWGGERTFGGERRHEGCDMMSVSNVRGEIPVVSMTDGVVENLGWLKLGGYRIGIRSNYQVYYYYAHLDRYAKDLKQGQVVKAGQLIGFMGDTGYSEVEGTVGKFDVHLHLGIYIPDRKGEDMSVNPYWIIKNLEKEEIEPKV